MPDQKKYKYFTTPIYYASGDLHAGHHYSTLIANILKAHYSHRGFTTLMLTGMDEHGEKVEESAKKINLLPQQWVDNLAVTWKQQMAEMDLSYDIFMRTTSKEHHKNVQEILQHCFDNGDIYFGTHTGHYCVGCESFLAAAQMDEQKNCLDHQRPTELREEQNYFFKTTKYKAQVIELLKTGKITANQRYINELVAIAENMDTDLSISRPKTRTTWGIELPFDKKHVTYVWFDALPNYITGIGGIEKARTSPFWQNCHHVIGKEITRFHAIFWPAILLSLDLPIPKLLITGWIMSDGLKMSKSLGNTSSICSYGRDAFANAALRITNPGEDLEILVKNVIERYNSDLANGIGNLLARTLGMIEKYFESTLPAFANNTDTDACRALEQQALLLPNLVAADMDAFKLSDALSKIWELIATTDKYISDKKPWVLAKDVNGLAILGNTLAHAVGSLRTIGLVAAAFFPAKMIELLNSIGENTADLSDAFTRAPLFKNIATGYKFATIPKLYLRIEPPTEAQPIAINKNKALEVPQIQGVLTIGIDDFSKVDIRVATVILAEHVTGSDKLLHLQVSLGDLGLRHIFAGLRQWVTPESIANKKLLVVANLAPRKMKFGMSEGMVLAASTIDNQIAPIFVSETLLEGAKLS